MAHLASTLDTAYILMLLFHLFIFTFTDYRRMYYTDLHEIFRIGRHLGADDRSDHSDRSRDNPILGPNHRNWPSFIVLTLQKGLQHRYAD